MFFAFVFKADGTECPRSPSVTKRWERGAAGGTAGDRAAAGCHLPAAGAGAARRRAHGGTAPLPHHRPVLLQPQTMLAWGSHTKS